MRSGRGLLIGALLAGFTVLTALTPGQATATTSTTWYTLSSPIQTSQIAAMPFGYRSYWLQPWRSQLVTRPAQTLEDAIGLDIDNQVTPAEMPSLAKLMHDSGFTRARLEIGWDQMSYSDPSALADPAHWQAFITAMRENDIRPLILLNADQGGPTPNVALSLDLSQAAPAGATTVQLASPSISSVVSGLTGFNFNGIAANDLITRVSGSGVATLSQPLPSALAAGPQAATTLLYAPFSPPYLADGTTPNPAFQRTLSGWLQYVKAVCNFVKTIYGSDNFDIEVWNESSAYISADNYYSPAPYANTTANLDETEYDILRATVDTLKEPGSGLTDVKVGDGFSNVLPWPSGSSVPAGTAALDKHPYPPLVNFPAQQRNSSGVRAIGAIGAPAYQQTSSNAYRDIFAPTFREFMPEYYLTGDQTETLMRDLGPVDTTWGGVTHGANQHPVGAVDPSMWITEVNMDGKLAESTGMPPSDVPEMEAKAALRFFTSMVSEGVTAVDLFAAKGGPGFQEINQAYFNAVDSDPGANPEDLAGPVMQAVARMLSTFAGAQNITAPRQLTLGAIASDNDTDVQFQGNGTSNFPSLYNRDVLTFFPFQVSQTKFVASVYVMTNNITRRYTGSPAAGQTSYDLPAETFRLTIGNVNGADAQISLYDPLLNQQEPATIVSRTANSIVVQLQATDSPRMLTINDGAATTAANAIRHKRSSHRISRLRMSLHDSWLRAISRSPARITVTIRRLGTAKTRTIRLAPKRRSVRLAPGRYAVTIKQRSTQAWQAATIRRDVIEPN